jgi:riboflavin-specific deaminase-like protein
MCLATSLDGRIATAPGQMPSFTSNFDKEKLFALRAESDCLLVGAGTVRNEKLPPLIRDEERKRERIQKGLAAHPAVAIVSQSLDLPWLSNYFKRARQDIYILTEKISVEQRLQAATAGATVLETGAPFSWKRALDLLYGRGFKNILVEGGGRLVHSLLKAGEVDRIQLTIAPLFIGAEGAPSLCEGPVFESLPRFQLIHQRTHEHELHLVYEKPQETESET